MSVKIKRKNPDAISDVYKRMKSFGDKEVAVGFPAGKSQAYPDGTGVATVAAYHVYGIGVPRRDFMGLALSDIKRHTKEIMKQASRASDERTQLALMETAGEIAKRDIQKAIVDLDDPPNDPKTIKAKGSSNPLIDTSHMLQSVTYIVRDK